MPLKKLLQKAINRTVKSALKTSRGSLNGPSAPIALSKNIDDNLRLFQQEFTNCSDFVYRELTLQAGEPIRVILCFIDGISNVEFVSKSLIPNLLQNAAELPHLTKNNALQLLNASAVTSVDTLTVADFPALVGHLLDGSLVMLIEDNSQALVLRIGKVETRAIEEPNIEPVVRGPRDGFVESLQMNISLIRRRIRSSKLKTELLTVGKLSRTRIALCYVEGLANPKVVDEIKARINRIQTDNILESANIEEFIIDENFSLFPLVQYTERPDVATAHILSGSVAIIVNNSPLALVAPITFNSLLQAAEDYYNSPMFATFIRLLRFVGLNIALLLPALTVAAFSYHQQLLPSTLLATIVSTRQQLPFHIVLEILFMEITFELLREAGARLPRNIGQAISTVGGLVIGQAAVQAGLVAPVPVIVVSLTAIAAFTIPNYAAGTSIRILRFALIILAGFMGGLGILFGLMMLLVYLCSLRSFGIPYLSPFAPLTVRDLKDTFIRVPWWAMATRPRLIGEKDPIRQHPDQGPEKPGTKGGKSGDK